MSVALQEHDHVPWVGLSDDADQREIDQARDRIEQATGTRLDSAACPSGDYNRTTLRNLRTSGVRDVYCSDGGWTATGERSIARYSVGAGFGPEQLTALLENSGITPLQRAKRTIKRWR